MTALGVGLADAEAETSAMGGEAEDVDSEHPAGQRAVDDAGRRPDAATKA